MPKAPHREAIAATLDAVVFDGAALARLGNSSNGYRDGHRGGQLEHLRQKESEADPKHGHDDAPEHRQERLASLAQAAIG